MGIVGIVYNWSIHPQAIQPDIASGKKADYTQAACLLRESKKNSSLVENTNLVSMAKHLKYLYWHFQFQYRKIHHVE